MSSVQEIRNALAAGQNAVNAWAGGEHRRNADIKNAAINAAAQKRDQSKGASSQKIQALSEQLSKIGPLPVPQRLFGQTLHFGNAHGKRLQCTGAGFGHSPNDGAWEHWAVSDAGGGRVYLTCPHHGMQIQASDNKKTVQPTKNKDAWEAYVIVDVGNGKFLFKSHHGVYLSQNNEGALTQSPNTAGWEQFSITTQSGQSPQDPRKAQIEAELKAAQAAAGAGGGQADAEFNQAVQAASAQEANANNAVNAQAAQKNAAKQALASQLEAQLSGADGQHAAHAQQAAQQKLAFLGDAQAKWNAAQAAWAAAQAAWNQASGQAAAHEAAALQASEQQRQAILASVRAQVGALQAP